MSEYSLKMNIERIEKKFYRTNSDKLRLDELHREMDMLLKEKKALMNEFNEKQTDIKNSSYNNKVFKNILSSLKNENTSIGKRRDNLLYRIKYIEKVNNNEKDKHKKLIKPMNFKKETYFRVTSNLLNNEFEKDKLTHKHSIIVYDIDILKERVSNLIKIANYQSFHFKKIMDKQLFAHFKRLFSFNILKKHQRYFKDSNMMMNSIQNQQQKVYHYNKETVDVLYDDCAHLNLKIKQLTKIHEEVLQEVRQIEEKKEEASKLKQNNLYNSRAIESLYTIINTLNNKYSEIILNNEGISEIETKTINCSEDYKVNVLKIIDFYRSFLLAIDYSHKRLSEVQSQIGRKKKLYKEVLDSADLNKPQNKKSKQNYYHISHIENNQLFINLQDNLSFLVNVRNFVMSFSKRLHKVINTINNVCLILDFDYQFIIMCPFYSTPSKINKKRSNFDIMTSHLLTDEKNNELTPISNLDILNDSFTQNNESNSNNWTLMRNPYVISNNKRKLDHVMSFYDDACTTLEKFIEYFTMIQNECKNDFKKRKTTLSKSIRQFNKNKSINRKLSYQKQSNRGRCVILLVDF